MIDKKRMIDCQNLTFSPELANARITKAESLFGRLVLRRILCFALFLLGSNRRAIAQMLRISFESVKTTLRVVNRDGLPAFEDRRRAASTFLPPPTAGLFNSNFVYLAFIMLFQVQELDSSIIDQNSMRFDKGHRLCFLHHSAVEYCLRDFSFAQKGQAFRVSGKHLHP